MISKIVNLIVEILLYVIFAILRMAKVAIMAVLVYAFAKILDLVGKKLWSK